MMSPCPGKTCHLLFMVLLTTVIFLVEIIVGYIRNSMALDDSLHILSGIVAMLVTFSSFEISSKKSPKNTVPWARTEVLRALVNSLFLVALCISIIVVAFKRFFEVETIHNSILICEVGILGLVLNIISLFMLRGYGVHCHSHDGTVSGSDLPLTQLVSTGVSATTTDDYNNDRLFSLPNSHSYNESSAGHMNLRGIYLHILGDALGSVIAIAFVLIVLIYYTNWKACNYIDLALSVFIVAIILYSVWLLLKDSALVLFQKVPPTDIEVGVIERRLDDKVDGVTDGIYDFHVWHLAGNKIIASAFIKCRSLSDYMQLADKVNIIFHNKDEINSTTDHPEFVEAEITENRDRNQSNDLTDDPIIKVQCRLKICCGPSKQGRETPTPPADTPSLCRSDSTYVTIDAFISTQTSNALESEIESGALLGLIASNIQL